ncbi:hypothetical protein FB550_10117 [Neobacillus bataviensis]|uniref:Uncharacterized protein n=1 Tax=Neobacillus bataviensis TaxID=220685 RepID=A0A561DXD1_9BACI|nr:hypothetical protein [Neobacillus bataviensis]TWE08006.1 hypothetical protein FB550_10117 [Neobacillus bataviensis]
MKLLFSRNERKLSNLFSFIILMLAVNLYDKPFSNNNLINFIFIFFLFIVCDLILSFIFKSILVKKNIEVGIGSYLIGAAIIATIGTVFG